MGFDYLLGKKIDELEKAIVYIIEQNKKILQILGTQEEDTEEQRIRLREEEDEWW